MKDPLTRLQEALDAQQDALLDLRNILQEYVTTQENIIKELEDKVND